MSPTRRTRGDGGLVQRHDHKTCPPAVEVVDEETGELVKERPVHRCKGRWQGTVPVKVGSSQRKYVYGRTQAEAQKKLRDAVRQRDAGTLVVSHLTVEKWLWHWLDEISDVRGNTYQGYTSKIRQYLVPHVGKHRLTALEPEHIRAMYKAMREQGLAESTLRQTHAILARSLKVAMQEGKIGRNPVQSVKPPSTKTKRREQLTMAQAQQVLAFTDDARWWLALFYGMRQGEVLGLRWRDVHLGGLTTGSSPYLEIVQTLQKDRDGKMAFGPPKSDAGERSVPLIPVMAARLKLAHVAAGGPEADSEALVFPGVGRKGEPVPRQPKKDWLAWRALLEAASTEDSALPPVSLHSARNTAASLLEAAGVPPRLVGQIIGHANVAQTEHYQHAEMERMFAALAAGASLLDVAELNHQLPELAEGEIVDE